MVTFLRTAAALALGTVIFAGLLFLLVAAGFTQRMEDPQVYKAAVSDTGAYTRIYDEVLLDQALMEQTVRLLGDIDIAARDEAVAVLREVMPPEYLREQAEANIDRFTGFLRGDLDNLEIHVDLEESLQRVQPTALGRVHRFVDDLEIVEPEMSGCSLQSLQRLAAESAAPYSQLAEGKLPQSVPSLKVLSRECREREFDRWFGLVKDDPALSARASRILGNEVEDLRRRFVEGDTRGFIKAVADPLVEPVIESVVADVGESLPPGGRIDLLEWLDEQPGAPSRAEIEASAKSLRAALGTVNGTGRNLALAMVILGSLLLALVHLPRPAAMLRWPGAALLAGGTACLVAGLVVNSVLPGLARQTLMGAAPVSADIPASAIALAGDLLESFTRQATGGFVPEAVAVMALGAALIAASLYYGRFSPLIGRMLPASRCSGNSGA